MIEKLKRITLCLLLGVTFVSILYWASGTPNTHKNGFKRNINPRFLTSFRSTDIDLPSFVLSGATKNVIYISNSKDPLIIHTTDTAFKKIESKSWKFPIHPKQSNLIVLVDSPIITVYDREKNIISTFSDNNQSLKMIGQDSIRGRQFDLGNRISTKSFVLRTINKNLNQYTLSKLIRHDSLFKENATAITKQEDGFLCSDGALYYDSSISRVVYLYFYRNEFLILDSNLNLINRMHTIDTVTHAQIKIHNFIKAKYVTFDAPTLIINKKSCVWRGRLYIQSGLLSDNEDRKMFSNNSITDVYDLRTDKYLFSFYIPHYNQFKVDGFQVFDNLLIAIQGNFIVSYIINPI